MVTVDQVVTTRDTLLLTEVYVEAQRLLLLADPANHSLSPAHLSALASLSALDQRLTNIRSVSALVTSAKSASPWTVGILALPGKMVDRVIAHLAENEIDAAVDVLQLVVDESDEGVERVVDMARLLAISQAHEDGFRVAEEFKLSPIVETAEQEKRLRQAVKIVHPEA
ncbi:hypothetical protein CYMTET_10623 [Cymbomonas tetramitiformis]|uniref:Uncharacterized protein n=1 Tax=Cymbomonas tetramitiformis TaxID=36881 RepID=A0AAE0GNZ9_9CHLO|nr:hypothetical protein CYMTET_10623 [Cymbomonas tetramitiformis]